MTNPERNPQEVVCEEQPVSAPVEILAPREVPLGGPRAMLVRRTLPQRDRSLIGAWCFVDHYGPDRVADSGGMSVAPHPHTGLQTVSWLFTGEIRHRDSTGTEAMVLPGELNLMTGGRGISHSEVSTPATEELHGVQLWVALPEESRNVAPGFEHYVPTTLTGAGWSAQVFLGSLLGDSSPVTTHTPLLGAQVHLDAGASLVLDVDPSFEHGVLLDTGAVELDGHAVAPAELAYAAPGAATLGLTATEDSRLLVLGGPPFGESIIMWWNFVGRTHEEIVEYRREWTEQITRNDSVVRVGTEVADGRFGVVVNEPLAPLPAPTLPNARLRERR